MLVIGFSWPVEHDNVVSVIYNGELVFASEEERCSHDISTLPGD